MFHLDGVREPEVALRGWRRDKNKVKGFIHLHDLVKEGLGLMA